MLLSTKIFRPEDVLRGKRVAVIGAADSAFEKENGKYIDSFDIIIRVNKAPHSWTQEKSKFIGTKTDIWFHSFFENNVSGGGPLNVEVIKKNSIKYLINPRADFASFRRTFNFYRKHKQHQKVYHLTNNFYRNIEKEFPNKFKPTIGFTALYSALHSECKELFITGFTFFKTPYANGYRDQLLNLENNNKHIEEQGIHSPNLEYKLFKFYLERSKCSKINLDDTLGNILKQE